MTYTRIECACGEVFCASGWTGGMTTASVLWKLHLYDGCIAVIAPGLLDLTEHEKYE